MHTVTLRLETALWERLKQQAAENHRSVNAEVSWMIEQSLKEESA